MSRTRSMPMAPMSSRRPRNGLMYVAPALAESSAWVAEKHSVWFTRMPLPLRYFTALSPSFVSGHFTITALRIVSPPTSARSCRSGTPQELVRGIEERRGRAHRLLSHLADHARRIVVGDVSVIERPLQRRVVFA